MNKLIIIGNVTREPELRTTPNGINVCTFSVAVNRRKPVQKDKKTGKVIERECKYIADFVYDLNGETVVEDAKGVRTDVFKMSYFVGTLIFGNIFLRSSRLAISVE